MVDMDETQKELCEVLANFPEGLSSQTRARLAGAYADLRLAKANELLANSIDRIATKPIVVETHTQLSGEVKANVVMGKDNKG